MGGKQMNALYLPLVAGIISTLFAFIMLKRTLGYSPGNDKMQQLSKYIQEGASAFLEEEARKIFLVAVIIAAVLGVIFQSFKYPIALLFGALVSELAGVIGMYAATRANTRVAAGAEQGLSSAFKVAFSSGSVMGLAVAGFFNWPGLAYVDFQELLPVREHNRPFESLRFDLLYRWSHDYQLLFARCQYDRAL